MDKNKIKSFAVWARRNLINAVSERANRIGINKNKILDAVAVQGGFRLEGSDEIFKLSKEHRDKLVKEIDEKGFKEVMEEAAYTWFNRFMGLRYMEVNGYLPSGIRVLSSEVQGKIEPDVLTRVSEIIDELNLNSEYIYTLLDSGKTEDREEAYKHILIKQCNELGKIIPQMFEKISDYTELLFPDNLLEDGSVIRKMVEDIAEEDWKDQVEIIGWMYQYYISEKKDEVFAALKKNVKITKENIPAATQLFTPKWIVKYMVENSLGRLWIEGHPDEELQKQWKYYLEEAEQEPEVEEDLKKIRAEHSKLKPEDIKVLDPCMGSGHILVYAFDVLYKIYQSVGYTEREISRKILQNNLYGLDIDHRAAQLASFALIMKARHYNRRLFREIEREHLELNLCSIQESNGISEEAIDYFANVDSDKRQVTSDKLREDVEYLIETFKDAKEYGSILEVKEVNFEALKQRLKEIENEDNFVFGDYRKTLLDRLPAIIKQAEIMSRKYDVCVTNPPYMGNRGMGNKLKILLDKSYVNSKNDLFAVFIERMLKFATKKGYASSINQHSWMFLSSFSKLRKNIIQEKYIQSLIHLGARAFDEIGGEVVQSVTFVLGMYKIQNYLGKYFKLTDGKTSIEKELQFLKKDKFYIKNQSDFESIPNMPIAYYITNNLLKVYKKDKNIGNYGETKTGMTTGENERFLRLWYEVYNENIGFGCENAKNALEIKKRWFPYSKGGGFRRWFGFNEYLVNWYNNGFEIKNNINDKGKKIASVRSESYYFKECITWSSITSNKFSGRFIDKGYLFDSGGSCLFIDNNKYFLALLNTKVAQEFLNISNNTINFQPGDISKIPVIECKDETYKINNLTNENILFSKNDWDSFETSWDFKIHPLLAGKCGDNIIDNDEIQLNTTHCPLVKAKYISNAFNVWQLFTEEQFNKLKHNEEELNRIFIDIYGLQDELTPEVEDKDITIRKADQERDIKSFISYAVGCMLGRYSIDAEGLIYAGGDFKDKWNIDDKKVRKIEKDDDGNVISESWADATFIPDADNVIPITEDEYFEDDIVSRFIEFVRIVYGKDTLEENLDFIADSIGRKHSETARQAIRRYFIKDFYKDHVKVYKKRPIYWMFDSGRNDGFKALIYMHRYNEQTVAKVRTDYLHTLQRKYEAEIQRQQLIVDSEEYTAKDRTAAKKKIARIAKQIEECREYDQVVAHLANEKISIDLDDGVNVNHAKFQGIKVINSKGKEVKMNLLTKI